MEIADLENRRCAALMAGDGPALAALVADDLIHIHGHGGIDDKAGYLAGVAHKYVFQDVSRGPLTIRVYGQTAVVTGALNQRFLDRATGHHYRVEGVSTQTWVRGGETSSAWRQNTCHNNFLTVEKIKA